MKKQHLKPGEMNKDTANTSDKESFAASVSAEERQLLDASQTSSTEDQQLLATALDNKDADGELLNVSSFTEDNAGRDLDIPGTDDDDEMEDIGEEDEANNPYSLSDNKD